MSNSSEFVSDFLFKECLRHTNVFSVEYVGMSKLRTGAQLGPYEIVSLLGAGGMGEVYKARDTRLNRLVAMKVLPEHVSNN